MAATTPILLLGAGRMGGALIEGWLRARAFAPSDLVVRALEPGPAALASGANLAPTGADLGAARTVVLAVKPQDWRAAAETVVSRLAPDAVIVSVAAGVATADIAEAFAGRRAARVMPTIAAAIGEGTASIFARDAESRARAHALFEPVGRVVDLDDEDLMHAATAISGSAPAYLYAFVEALEAAGEALGLTAPAARDLARSTLAGAAALMAQSDQAPAELRRQVASPGGTTEAALKVLMGEAGLEPLLKAAAAAAERRSRELGQ
ncbi:MAG: pyrroline-5-carboxylate reductase [Caulobacteraceae bacterium]